MKNLLRVGIAGGVLLVLCMTIMVKASRTKPGPMPPQQPSDKRRDKLARLQIHDFHGEAGLLRAKQLRKLNKGVARAMKEADKLGLHEAFEHGRVILGTDPQDSKSNATTRLDSFAAKSPLIRPASYRFSYPQDTFTDGEYEVTFIPYDDGDPNTWEGIIYRYDPDWGDDIRFGILDISTDETQVTQEVYYPSDGGDPQPIDPIGPAPILSKNQSRTPSHNAQYESVKFSSCSGCGDCRPPNRCCLRLRDECCTPPPNLQPWLRCAAKGCMGATLCVASGPGWSFCWGVGCGGAMLLCVF